MPDRSILIVPDVRLKQPAAAVGCVDDAVRQLMDDMLAAMYRASGIGLAAPQVGILQRVIVVDVSGPDEPGQPMRLADPEILWHSGERSTGEEGCLSLPDQFAEVTRPARVRVRYRDEHDQPQEIEADGLLGKCLQHEIDHLNGTLFVDHLSSLKRGIILRKLTKAKRQVAAAE
ncbi:peptide deformylase [Defluviicoccus vanus]|uniref:Peptide deformylase n=1 Tax=Defluviicoccus vanus TaxID=111831 RepID=A0A7H1N4L5_9PROT|nr:peptide deformylase [Defluviicoccus vanus]QNT70651.1 peptide deformylase [Defluviicoccus vanus]